LVCLAGVAVAAAILYVHGQIDRLGDGYTSFCTINSSINCDRVLSSRHARLAGLPVAWLALAAYLGMAGVFAAAARSAGDRSRRLLALGGAGVIGALVFSTYMAVISILWLQTICLLCSGLYAVSVANTALALAALRVAARDGSGLPLKASSAAAIFGLAVASVTGIAFFTWPRQSAVLSSDIRDAEDVRNADPEFYKWYTDLPRVDPSTLVRDEQAKSLPSDKVVIVDFFDLECGHCKKSYQMVKELAARRGDRVQVIHRHFPLDATCNDIVTSSVHPNACRAAEAVECAGLLGKHDEMLEILFANQGQLFIENLTRLAGKIGLDKAAMQKCLDEHRTLPLVLADARAGARLEITSTPTVFVGGRRIQGVLEEVSKYEAAVLIDSPHGS